MPVSQKAPPVEHDGDEPRQYCEHATIDRPGSDDELDEQSYLRANPDVQKAGMDARTHFLKYGRQEGRVQFVNEREIAAVRTGKLSRVRFARRPAIEAAPGAALDFLSDDMRAAFEIPLRPPVSAHDYPAGIVDKIRASPDRLFLDVGAGVRRTYHSNVVNTEIYVNPSTDVVCLAENLPFESDQFDFVLCMAVLEHTKRPWDAARELCRVVKPGGMIMVDNAFLQPVHGYPHHYFNATPKGNSSLFEDVCDVTVQVGVGQGPIYALTWMLREWKRNLPPEDARQFGDMRVDDFLQGTPAAQEVAFYCRNLSPEARGVLAAGSTVYAVRR